jgi:hypothetical protein
MSESGQEMTVDVLFIRQALWRLRNTLLSIGTAPLGVLEGDREFAIMLAMKIARTVKGRPLHEKYVDYAGLDMPTVFWRVIITRRHSLNASRIVLVMMMCGL